MYHCNTFEIPIAILHPQVLNLVLEAYICLGQNIDGFTTFYFVNTRVKHGMFADVAMLTGCAETPAICVTHRNVARLSIAQVCRSFDNCVRRLTILTYLVSSITAALLCNIARLLGISIMLQDHSIIKTLYTHIHAHKRIH